MAAPNAIAANEFMFVVEGLERARLIDHNDRLVYQGLNTGATDSQGNFETDKLPTGLASFLLAIRSALRESVASDYWWDKYVTDSAQARQQRG